MSNLTSPQGTPAAPPPTAGSGVEAGAWTPTNPNAAAPEFIADFYESFTREVVAGGDAGTVVDRYFAPGITQIADGITLDRQRLIDHLHPVRKNLTGCRYEVHEALRSGDQLAAHFTIHAELRHTRTISTEVFLFGELTPDNRFHHTTQSTRELKPQPTDPSTA
ncbi:nuclear transport factor 2 family protein [Kribbella solani]|uniref:nuclear transport factor 2 family protein n=1 Tax=Kribbella solani TaxID=236067 RepID=UPI0029AEA8D6|nr:nuclear transport factor 2 family protein [Kribbella solani]MDX2972442.1 nuclear transport factor 2 family protein [Kribbella solani]